jgi:hypothetical protein
MLFRNPSTGKAEIGGSKVQGQSELYMSWSLDWVAYWDQENLISIFEEWN